MKKIKVSYSIEIPEDQIDKVCFKAKTGKRNLELDIKHMAEISGRHRVYEFISGFIELKQVAEANEKR